MLSNFIHWGLGGLILIWRGLLYLLGFRRTYLLVDLDHSGNVKTTVCAHQVEPVELLLMHEMLGRSIEELLARRMDDDDVDGDDA